MTAIPDKPEPPAEVFATWRGGFVDAWVFSLRADGDPNIRYVLAPEGSLVLDPDMARVFTDWLHAEPEPGSTLTEATFDFRGGAS